jgi:hypothetical protein
MDPNYIAKGDEVDASPIGPGTVTGISDAGYPQVNHVAVACLRRVDGKTFDPYGHYKNGVPDKDKVKQQ